MIEVKYNGLTKLKANLMNRHERELYILRKSPLDFLEEYIRMYYYKEDTNEWKSNDSEMLFKQIQLCRTGECDLLLYNIDGLYRTATYNFRLNIEPEEYFLI